MINISISACLCEEKRIYTYRLLAVIVILAVIALIATPLIMNTIVGVLTHLKIITQ